MSERVCRVCGVAKPETDNYFPRHSAGRRGLRTYCKSCDAERQRKRCEEKRDEINAAHRERRLQDSEYAERMRAASRESHSRRMASPEVRESERQRASVNYWRDPDAHHARTRDWARRHPDAVAAYTRNRRARIDRAPGEHTPDDIIAQRARQKGRCYWCHMPAASGYEVDHVIPIARGGGNGPENLVVSCEFCNRSKGSKHPMDFAGVMF